ncbi:MAG TPA: divalent-cation tolerance protein CutA [Steroidobacteraceae bacterium]|nr:divalent-cation tolerance protein CutA [Steroidobacteraceae bacterium]
MKPIAIFTTTGSLEEARRIARELVERRLAACAQISEIESFYRWQGAVQNEKEFRILIKTTAAQYAAVESAVRELHSYELPAIYSMPFEEAYGPYAKWIADESAGVQSTSAT